jgi:hypothetical protein
MAIFSGDAIAAFSDANDRGPSLYMDDLRIPLDYHTSGQKTLALVVPSQRLSLQGIPRGQTEHYDFYGVVTIDERQLEDWRALGVIQGVHATGQQAKAQADTMNAESITACRAQLRKLSFQNIQPSSDRESLLSWYDDLKITAEAAPARSAQRILQPL